MPSSHSYLISCAFPSLPRLQRPTLLPPSLPKPTSLNPRTIQILPHSLHFLRSRRSLLQVCWDSTDGQAPGSAVPEVKQITVERNGSGGGGGSGNDWTTSVLLCGLWAGLMYYVFNLAPDQTPVRDSYFLQKLLNLKGDDGFRMNEVLVALWYIMGLWPLVYSILLIPSGRSSRSKVPVWPFLVLSCCAGMYALIPYFVLWKPPPPAVEEDKIRKWPLNFLESKITAGASFAAGLGLMVYAGLASGDVWKEFFQYFRESKFIHIMSLDFLLFTVFSPFWVYNDMTARKWIDKGSWLLPTALVPFVGPALYLLLRPPLSALPVSMPSVTIDED